MTQETPKTLTDAIEKPLAGTVGEGISIHIEPHIRDFLAQKFTTALLEAQTMEQSEVIAKLWEKITGRKI